MLSVKGSSVVIFTLIISYGKGGPTLDHESNNMSHRNKWVYDYMGLYTGGDETHTEEKATEN